VCDPSVSWCCEYRAVFVAPVTCMICASFEIFVVRATVSRCVIDYNELRNCRNSRTAREYRALRRKESKRRPTAVEYRSHRPCSSQARFSVFANSLIILAQLLSILSNILLSIRIASQRLQEKDRYDKSTIWVSKFRYIFEPPIDLAEPSHKKRARINIIGIT